VGGPLDESSAVSRIRQVGEALELAQDEVDAVGRRASRGSGEISSGDGDVVQK
jgi:hypothetical protein